MRFPNNIPQSQQQDLTALARRIREEHQTAQRAFANALAGDALIAHVATGWGRWLHEHCSTARAPCDYSYSSPDIARRLKRR
jgi:hypothetical protein